MRRDIPLSFDRLPTCSVSGCAECGTLPVNRAILEALYGKYNRRELVHPDPLEVLYGYDDPLDREIVGLVASSLAYGRVAQILKSVAVVLDRMPSPAAFLRRASRRRLRSTFADFKHRFTTGVDLAGMLYGAKCVIERYGSLEACFLSALEPEHCTVLPALSVLFWEMSAGSGCSPRFLLPSPVDGSACKRANLFLRWMVRRDDVDPGGWRSVPASLLVVPLDTHMHRIGLALGLTKRKQADLRTAAEMTAAFRTIAPEDPVRYDFALTRLGIRTDTDLSAFLARCGVKEVSRHD